MKSITDYISQLKLALKRFSTWLHGVITVVAGGAVGAASQLYADGSKFVLSADHIAHLKAAALSGAVTALIFHVRKSLIRE